MDRLLSWWEERCRSAGPLRFIDIVLRGIGQVMFQDNPVSGLLFLIAVGWGSYAGRGTAGGHWRPARRRGGDRHRLVAAGRRCRARKPAFTATTPIWSALRSRPSSPLSPLLWIYLVIGAMVSVVATLAVANLMKTWGVAALTAPFILVTWLLLLSAYAFSGIHGEALPASGQIAPILPGGGEPARDPSSSSRGC